LQNNLTLDVEVITEAYSCTICFVIKKKFVVNFVILISTLITTVESGVKHENIIKLKCYMYELSIYQTKYCKNTFLALTRLSYITFNRQVVSKTTLLRQKLQQSHDYYRIATKLAKAY